MPDASILVVVLPAAGAAKRKPPGQWDAALRASAAARGAMSVPLPSFFTGSVRDMNAMTDVSLDDAADSAPRSTSDGPPVDLQHTVSSPGPATVLKSGPLQKRTTGKLSARWAARFVVVDSEYFCYYDSKNKHLDLANLPWSTSEKPAAGGDEGDEGDDDGGGGKGGGKGKPARQVLQLSELSCRLKDLAEHSDIFILQHTSRSYEWRAPSPAEAAEWVACVSAAAERASGPSAAAGGPAAGAGELPAAAAPITLTRELSLRERSTTWMAKMRRKSSKPKVMRSTYEDAGSSEWEDVSPASVMKVPSNPSLGFQDVSGPAGGVCGSLDELSDGGVVAVSTPRDAVPQGGPPPPPPGPPS